MSDTQQTQQQDGTDHHAAHVPMTDPVSYDYSEAQLDLVMDQQLQGHVQGYR